MRFSSFRTIFTLSVLSKLSFDCSKEGSSTLIEMLHPAPRLFLVVHSSLKSKFALKPTHRQKFRFTHDGLRRLRNDEGDSLALTMGLKFGERTTLESKGEKLRVLLVADFCGIRNLKPSDLFDMFGELVMRKLLFNVTFGDTKSRENGSDNHKMKFHRKLPPTYVCRLAP